MSNHKLAIVGPREVVLGFKAIGLETEFSMNSEDTMNKLVEMKNSEDDYAIIFIPESHAKDMPEDEYKKLTSDALPAIIALPGPEGSTGFGIKRLGQIVEKAIGSNILR